MDFTSNLPPVKASHAIQRLTALWAFSEAGLGGVLHAFSLPFTALSVGGIAVILITLIASYSERPFRAILRATLIVLIVKAAVSPHSPVMAYVAVSFQGLIGAIIFGLTSRLMVGAMALGTLAMLESSLQKLFTLTVIYGTSLWEAIDALFHYAGRQLGVSTEGLSLSVGLISGYVGLYVFSGLVIGWLAARMVRTIREEQVTMEWSVLPSADASLSTKVDRPWYKRPWLRYTLVLLMLAVAMVLLQDGQGAWQTGLYVIARSLLVVSLWLGVLGPLLKKALDRWLARQQHRYANEVEDALQLLPVLRHTAGPVWQAQQGKGWKRVWHFLVIMIHFALTYEHKEP